MRNPPPLPLLIPSHDPAYSYFLTHGPRPTTHLEAAELAAAERWAAEDNLVFVDRVAAAHLALAHYKAEKTLRESWTS